MQTLINQIGCSVSLLLPFHRASRLANWPGGLKGVRIGINWESTIDLRNTRSTIVTIYIYIYTIQKKCKKELIFGYWKFLCWKCPTCSTISVGNSVDIFCHTFRPSERPIIRDVPGDAPRMCIPSSSIKGSRFVSGTENGYSPKITG